MIASSIESTAYVADIPVSSFTLIPLIPRPAALMDSRLTVILLVISASAPTCKEKFNLSFTSTEPLLISKVPSLLFTTVAAVSVPIEEAF